MSDANMMRGEQAPTIVERTLRRPRRLIAGIIGLSVLSGCVGDSDAYVPLQADHCAIVSSRVMVPEYEADRWADGIDDRQRLQREIESTMQKTSEGPRYAVCVDAEGEAHATRLDRMDNQKRYIGYVDEGFSGAGTIAIPALLEQEAFTEQYQTAIDPNHGT